MENESKPLRRRKVITVLLLAVIVAAGALAGIYWNKSDTAFKFDEKAEDQALSAESTNDKADKNTFLISMNTIPEFENGNSEGNLKIQNDIRNHYVMKVEIRMDQNHELIYKTEGIKPGQVIKKDKLDKILDSGKYPCTAVFTAYDEKQEYLEMGQAAVKIEIYINE